MKKNYFCLALLFMFLFSAQIAVGQIYSADFSNNGDGFTDHTSGFPPAPGPASVGPFGSAGNQWFLSYTTAPNTDGTANSFKVVGGSLVSDDWGGQGIFESQSIDLTGINTINISALSSNSGANDNTFVYFYILDGGSRVSTDNISSGNGDAVNYSVASLDVSSNSSIVVGFEFSENGSGDGYTTTSFTVTNAENSGPSVDFDSSTSSETETDATFNTNIPVTLTNYDADVTIDIAVDGSSTAEAGDYTLNTTSLVFDANETLNISLDINDDADNEDETVILNITVSSGTADLGTSQHTVTITDDEVPPLIITEVADPVDFSGRFVEIYNTGDTSLDLSSLQVYFVKSVNAGSSYQQRALSGTIEPNEVFVIASATNMNNDYGFIPDEDFSEANGNGDDAYAIYYGGDRSSGTLLDAFGVQGVDGSGEAWEYENSRAIRNNPKSTSPNATWTSGEWTISSGDLADMTPGALENEFRYDGDWKPRDVYINSTTSDNIYISSSVSLTGNLSIQNFEVESSATVTINSGISLIVGGSSSGNITYKRNLPNGSQWYLMSSPVTGESYDDTWVSNNSVDSGTNNNIGIGTWDNTSSDTDMDGGGPDTATGNWRYFQSGAGATSFGTGQGHAIIRSAAGNISFEGNGLNNSSQAVAITQGASNNFNLVGNPFTAYLNLGDFFEDNPITTVLTEETAWFWNGSSYDARTSGLHASFEIAPGQGFFIEANADTNLTFDYADVSHQGTDSFQRTVDRPEISLFISDGNQIRYANIYYIDDTTTGFDPGFDATLFGGESQDLELYSQILTDNIGDKYQLQSLPNNDYANMIIPIGVTAQIGTYTFTADTFNLPSGLKVFLEDKLTNEFTRLDEANASYEVNFNEAVSDAGRFFIHTSTEVLSTSNPNLDYISIYTSSPQNLRIVGIQSGNAKVSMFNILGAKVMSSTFLGDRMNDIPLPNLKTGVYIVQLETETGTLNKKVIIE